ncbi:hypothetical protein H6F86_02065 [Phormidium sp. FACHB-592]|uniref:Uncharacterized protein n=1 Tax=Stenomitos frigidus AS-A4 TaxID=2933935 RepID=A0ABV0KJW8_9CYAN|nr:hypothetical protein [Phormidium sp. FACHB-592]MBD2072692.1 hypothetical protein [Phormidium sp. FACHB-592]
MSRQLHPAWILAYLLCILAIVAVGSIAIAHVQKSVKVPAPHLPQIDAGS